MVTMKGFTFSLPLLLLLPLNVHTAEPAPSDYLPASASMMLLPTTAGTGRAPTNLTKNAGQLADAYSSCGKVTVNSYNDLDLPYKSSFEITLDCYPHPMRAIVKTDGTAVDGPDSEEFDAGKCQGLQTCSDFANLTSVNHGNTPVATVLDDMKKDAVNTLDDKNSICGGSPQNILFSNELGECTIAGYPTVADQPNGYITVPRWATKADGFFEVLRPFMHKGFGEKKDKRFDRTNSFISFQPSAQTKSSHLWKPCHGSCDRGHIVKMNMKPGSWKTTIYLRASTKGFKVCIDAEGHEKDNVPLKCRPKFEMYVLPQNGVVVWPKSGRASILEMKGPSVLSNKDAKIAIELGYGYGTGKNGKLSGEFYVGNMYREVAVSDSDGWTIPQASRVSFFFQDGDDLASKGGIYSQNIESASTYIDKTEAGTVENLPPRSAKSGSQTSGNENLTLQKEPPLIPLQGTTTPAPKRLSSNAQAGVLLVSSDYSNDAIYMPGKWWAWGLYIGFIIGSIVGAAIIGAIFYVLRRTVYGFWYRGMYKRYGCDASGTTGGITGVGFGTTTVGAITVGGTTGGGGTTAGTTGTSASTTGGTTGSMTSTGGASTIAM